MDASAAKFIGAGLAMLGMVGAGIGLGIMFGNYFQAPCATRRPPLKSVRCCSWAWL